MTQGGPVARRIVVGAAWMVAWRFLTRTLGLVSTIVLARLLVPADFGLVLMASTFTFAIDGLTRLGLQDALVRHPDPGPALIDTAFTLQALRGLLTAFLIALGAPPVAWWFHEPRLVPVLLVLAAAALISGLENTAIAGFSRDMRFDRHFRLRALPRLLQLATSIPVALATHSYWALPAGTLAGAVARTAMTWAAHPHRPRLRRRLPGWRDLAGFSFWTWAATVAALVWDRGDPFLLGPAFGADRLGLYLLALEVAILPVTELVVPAAEALFAGFAAAENQGMRAAALAPRVAAALLLGILPVVIGLSCTSGYVVAALLGPKWEAARMLIAILAWQGVFSPFSFVCNTTLVAAGFVRRNFVANVLASAVKLAGLLAAVALSHRLEVVAAAATAIVAAEAACFSLLLAGTGQASFAGIAGSLLRGSLAVAATLATLAGAGLAWHPVTLAGFPALVAGGLVNLLALVLFWGADVALWRLSGAPDGAEAMLFGFVRRHILAPLAARRFAPRSTPAAGV